MPSPAPRHETPASHPTQNRTSNGEGRTTFELIHDDDIFIDGKIDDNSKVTLVSRNGSITIAQKIDNNCTVTLIAARDIRIGTTGGDPDGDRKIDNNCTVEAEAGGVISLGSRINNHCNVKFDARERVEIGGRIDDNSRVAIQSGGLVSIGDKIDNNSVLELRAVEDVTIGGKIDNNCNVTIDTLRGGITIAGKIDDNTTVSLSAADDIHIGTSGGSDDRKINNRCRVHARSGGQISVGDKLGDNCIIEFRACGPITIGGVVERGCHASFETHEGNNITLRKIRDSNTRVTYFGGTLVELESRHQTPTVRNSRWVAAPLFCAGPEIRGEWWQNWAWKYAYVTEEKSIPETLEELVAYVQALRPEQRTKAVGGAWSFTDASLPFDTEEAVDNVSMEKRGIGGTQAARRLFEGAPADADIAYDHHPNSVARDREVSTTWSQERLTNEVTSGFHLPGAGRDRPIIDTRRLCSSLQTGFSAFQSSHVRDQVAAGRHFFHVEAGITMEDLYILLDHQKPRLAVQATGGSRGATLGGTLSTATHGGEFVWPLLIDRVKAIHLVGAGGEEWWIEGSESIADFSALTAVYPNIDVEHFVAGDWTHAECGETYTPQDVLRAVTVSMGTMGVIYSVVLEVVPAFGIQQKVKRLEDWNQVLTRAQVTVAQLQARDPAANRRLLDFILDGAQNGTGIPRAENVYVDFAVNPITLQAWITNRRVTPRIPRESKTLDGSLGRFEKSFSRELTNHSAGIFGLVNNEMLARLMDFLNYGRSLGDIENNIEQVARLLSFILDRPPLLSTLLSTANAQLVINELYRSESSRKREFFGDILTGVLNVLKGTVTEDVSDVSDVTGPSSKVGATGFTDEGLPGKALEIALPPEIAFSFFQALLDRLALPGSPPLLGYLAIRVVPETQTLMGMQQFGEFSVMIEPFAFRTPESLHLIQQIMDDLASWNRRFNAGGMLHWGLENDSLTRERFEDSAVTRPYRSGSSTSKLVVFKAVKKMLQGDHPPAFDNWFVKRLGLDDYLCESREITQTQKRGRNVVGLCNPGQPWSPVSEAQAVRDIRSRGIRYFVASERAAPVFLRVVEEGALDPFLQTEADGRPENNLTNLPDC